MLHIKSTRSPLVLFSLAHKDIKARYTARVMYETMAGLNQQNKNYVKNKKRRKWLEVALWNNFQSYC